MNDFFSDFEDYCKTPRVDSGKAGSYSKAIQYLCDFLGEKSINEDVVIKIRGIETYLSLSDSQLYKDLLDFLEKRRQSSYLLNGFIKAALPYLYDFWDNNHR